MLQALTNWTVLEIPVSGIGAEAQRLYNDYLNRWLPRQMGRHWQAYNDACPKTLSVDQPRQQRWCQALSRRASTEAAVLLAGHHFEELFLDLPNQPALHEELFRTLQRDRLLDGVFRILDDDKLRLVLQLSSAMDEFWQAE